MPDLTRVIPEVRTISCPTAKPLLAARREIKRNPALQVLFVQAKAANWPPEQLAEALSPLLEPVLEGTREAIWETSLYLADEYVQVGDGLLVVSRETGRVVAQITEEDIWVPAPVRREDGGLAQPLPRLRPDLEGFLVQWTFDRSREEQYSRALTPAGANTSMAQALTHTGRKAILARLQSNAPEFLTHVGGAAKEFLGAFQVIGSDATSFTGLTPLQRTTAFAQTRTLLADFRATNLRFDFAGTQEKVLGALWVQEIARDLALQHPTPKPLESDFIARASDSPTVWVGSGVMADICGAAGKNPLLIDSPIGLALSGTVGVLQVHPDTYRVEARHVMDRWDMAGSVEYTVWVDWACLEGFILPREAPTTVVI